MGHRRRRLLLGKNLILPALERPANHLILRNYVHNAAPTADAVAIDATQKALRDHLEEVLGLL